MPPTFLQVLSLFLTILSKTNYQSSDKTPTHLEINQEYDFVIVGGGSAGSVLASRLSEIPQFNILLLEAGEDEEKVSDIPIVAENLQRTKIDWEFQTEPQSTACLGNEGGRCNWPRGKVLGGSSVLNYMLYVRGNRKDYDGWAAMGNIGWDYKSLLPYFKKSEDNQNSNYTSNPEYHSKGGYLTVGKPPFKTQIGSAFVQAGKELGYEIRDGNGEFQTGFMPVQGTIRKGSRRSAAKAFLRPARKRPNLHISLQSHVINILIDEQKRAVRVQFKRHGKVERVKARREVILSAGAVNSSQILMLFGIGPREHLQEMNIPIVKDAAVGKNLQDHIAYGVTGLLIFFGLQFSQHKFNRKPHKKKNKIAQIYKFLHIFIKCWV